MHFQRFLCLKAEKGRKSKKFVVKFSKKSGILIFKFAPEHWSRILFPDKKTVFGGKNMFLDTKRCEQI